MTISPACQRLLEELQRQGIHDHNVLKAIAQVPREVFVDPALKAHAYDNVPLPIAEGQTISQPYIVAHMTALLLHGKKLNRVLEIGTGCGYQAAVLAQLVDNVYSIERIQTLSEKAQQRLDDLNINNVFLKYGDGYLGWPEYAPFDGIIVTAAAKQIPSALIEQLKIGGRLIIPLEENFDQVLTVIERQEHDLIKTSVEYVRFVPMLQGKQ